MSLPRLAAVSGRSVVLLERGRQDSSRWIHIPATFFKALQSQDAGPGVSTMVGSNRLDDAIRERARTIFQPAGTCRMGPSEAAVVDLKLRVNGIEGLRVADCSVMPSLVSGNTNAPTMMIADRAVDFILAGQ